ncbi:MULTISPECIES: LysR substrate-binding domain-containing protein [Delftia]|jgi:LysR family glycine cleavage system transcriptional activator|uniref:Transcriptional regulator, LysR family n=5 Tax=Delftia acidovorans TaxID=80866 RepID=A9BYI4_DELAS|nr:MULTISPECIES: LysR substrate-binding domain-containing protein [Delftia]MBA4004446.1 LysR family transcriptional regulator [Delftia sp.]OLE94240.1 MAG: LysR family transcriptional regulator [Delftia sp. 13_1_40CM_3_66_6]ABX34527.1 transcriptional regulator, LysR family [Delftia acidovorans SPH-1]KZK29083.1 LysR family transcriptional regulator [Delftia sp. GW456-R20]MCP4019691.1 LysR family transcriptional regulator [Delftia sp.]
MHGRIPPLNPLKVFEVVARTRNLTQAARELHISQSAVSKQLNVLQTYLGVELFRRERHGISLTLAGQRYGEAVAPAFEGIGRATDEIMRSGSDNTLRLQTYTTFAAKWLIPRLQDFNARHGDIAVVITNSVKDVDFDRDHVDLAIQMGHGAWQGVDTEFLFEDVIEPVCSPAFLHANAPEIAYPQALLRKRLLVSHYRKADWQTWARLCRYEDEIDGVETMRFSSSVLTWQAAADGLGIAIGQTALLVDDINGGRLVAPFGLPVRTGASYYLVTPRLQRQSRKVQLFSDWLKEQI